MSQYELRFTNYDARKFGRYFRRILFLGILVYCGACSKKTSLVQQQQIQLSNPIIESDSTFFVQDLPVDLTLNLSGVDIRYTLDDSDPTSRSSLYSGELILTNTTKVKARAFHSDYLPSEIVERQFVKTQISNPIKTIKLNREPHENYSGIGSEGLIDYVKGTKDFKSKAWVGFAGGDLELLMEVSDNEELSQVQLSLLSNQSAWIFLPESMEIYSSDTGKEYNLIGEKKIIVTKENSESEFRFVSANFPPQRTNFIKVILKNIKEIPEWHPGKGTPPWLFIDEVLVE